MEYNVRMEKNMNSMKLEKAEMYIYYWVLVILSKKLGSGIEGMELEHVHYSGIRTEERAAEKWD